MFQYICFNKLNCINIIFVIVYEIYIYINYNIVYFLIVYNNYCLKTQFFDLFIYFCDFNVMIINIDFCFVNFDIIRYDTIDNVYNVVCVAISGLLA